MRAERVNVGVIGRTQGSLVSAWLDRPVKQAVVLVLVVLIVAAPAWLLADWLKNFALHPTDFIYIEEAIDGRALRNHLFAPLNTHVVPLFRLYTYAVVQSTDRLEDLPRMLLGASYLGLVATMLLVGRLVRQETGAPGRLSGRWRAWASRRSSCLWFLTTRPVRHSGAARPSWRRCWRPMPGGPGAEPGDWCRPRSEFSPRRQSGRADWLLVQPPRQRSGPTAGRDAGGQPSPCSRSQALPHSSSWG